jgi:serine/threonine-protein kinase
VAEAAVVAAPSGLVLGRYRPLQPLGSGGSGSVWLARDVRAGVEVALKIVPREGNASSRAEREAAAAAHLRHPHCQRAYALAHDDRHVYIAYEYVPGRTMREALRAGELTDAEAVEATAQVLDALAYAHAQRIVHRDVKPANVLLADGDEVSVRLLDFGLARMDGADTLTAAGDVPGTLAYISPERLGGAAAEPAADVWAVGVMLWEALAGVHPFWKGSLVQTAQRIERGAPSLARPRPDLPERLVNLVDRALSLDPARRPSAEQLASGLRETFTERERRRVRITVPPLQELWPRALPAAAAALFAGWTAASVPFYPSGAAAALAAVAGGLTLRHVRIGLAFTLLVPLFPLGNISAGLAWSYAGLALAWLALSWRDARSGLFLAAGPLLAPLSALGLLPLASQAVRGRGRRVVQVAAAILLAALVAGLRRAPLPFTGAAPPKGLGIAGSNDPFAVLVALARTVATHQALLLEAASLAGAAALLPLARTRGVWGIACFGTGLLAITALVPAGVSTWPLVLSTWLTCIGLAAVPER